MKRTIAFIALSVVLVASLAVFVSYQDASGQYENGLGYAFALFFLAILIGGMVIIDKKFPTVSVKRRKHGPLEIIFIVSSMVAFLPLMTIFLFGSLVSSGIQWALLGFLPVFSLIGFFIALISGAFLLYLK